MKNILLIAMIISSLGCQTTSPSVQEQESDLETTTGNDTGESPAIGQTSNPGELLFTLEILESFSTAREICGISKDNVVKIRVMEVVEKGMGISNIPKPNDEILVSFMRLPSTMGPAVQFEVKAKEFLCLDASKSYFTVISHKILE